MSPHVAEQLPQLLTGEASRSTALDAAAHLRTCVDCQQELVSALVAHAALSSAQRFARDAVVGLPGEALRASGESGDAHDPAGGPGNGPGDAEPPPLPDLSAVFAQARREAAETSGGRRIGRSRVLVAAAAAAVVVGGGAAAFVTTRGGGPAPAPAGRTVALAAFGAGHTPARATITQGGQVRIDAASLPDLAGRRYEVWLTNSARTRMQPVGWLSAEGTAAMSVPPDLLSRFTDIEVSVQDVSAAAYTYSGTSVLRGAYS